MRHRQMHVSVERPLWAIGVLPVPGGAAGGSAIAASLAMARESIVAAPAADWDPL